MTTGVTAYRRFVALGDSFTEGLCDPPSPGAPGEWRGWADRVAQELADRAHHRGEPFEYANLAVRGRLLGQIVDDQVPAAIDLRPDLVSIVGGGNDVLRPGVDVDAVTDRLEAAVARLRATGATVVMATSYDPRHAPLIRRTRGLAAVFAANVWSIARRQGAVVLDLWGMRVLHDQRMWAPDRIHLTALGHERVAAQALDVLDSAPRGPAGDADRPVDEGDDGARGADGADGEAPLRVDWRALLDPLPPTTRREAWREDALWLREHVVPWVGRRLRGRSSGDGLTAKRPLPVPFGSPFDSPFDSASAGPSGDGGGHDGDLMGGTAHG
jgi:lysophospholipase L1-like esterase